MLEPERAWRTSELASKSLTLLMLLDFKSFTTLWGGSGWEAMVPQFTPTAPTIEAMVEVVMRKVKRKQEKVVVVVGIWGLCCDVWWCWRRKKGVKKCNLGYCVSCNFGWDLRVSSFQFSSFKLWFLGCVFFFSPNFWTLQSFITLSIFLIFYFFFLSYYLLYLYVSIFVYFLGVNYHLGSQQIFFPFFLYSLKYFWRLVTCK